MIFCQYWYLLTIFDYFWDWKCYRITKKIFQTFSFTENHQCKSKLLEYHSCKQIFSLIFNRENTKLAFSLKAIVKIFGFQWISVGTCISKMGNLTSYLVQFVNPTNPSRQVWEWTRLYTYNSGLLIFFLCWKWIMVLV